MARTVRTKVYKFNELGDKAQQKAIEWYRETGFDYEWHELNIESWEDDLRERGFMKPKIYFSGFSSQGDGACFTCEYIDFKLFLEGKYNKYKEADLNAYITHNSHYYYATSTTVILSEGGDLEDNDHDEIEQAIKDERERLGNEIYKSLEDEWDYLNTNAQIAETIQNNEYEFTQDGRRF